MKITFDDHLPYRHYVIVATGLFLCGLCGPTQATQTTTTHYQYDAMDNVTSVTDPLGHVTQGTYDELNRMIRRIDPALGVIQSSYNARGDLSSVTDPRNLVTGYEFDGLGNQLSATSPDTGTTHRTFDASGNLITTTDAKGQTTSFTYDVLNRVTRRQFADGQSSQFVYDQGIYGIGRLTQITDVSGSTSYGYDQYGRVVQDTRKIQGASFTTAYAYDNAGRLAELTYPSGRQLVYSRDEIGLISQIVSLSDGSSTTVAANITYDATGKLRSFVNGAGSTVQITYDLDGRTTSYSLNQQTRTLTYDDDGRLTTQVDPDQTIQFDYDEINRLTSAVHPGTSFSYGYDSVGNRSTKGNGGMATQYSYGSQNNRLTQISGAQTRAIQSDANGSIINDGNNLFSYDGRGRLVAAQTVLGAVEYKINALGQRVAKITPTTTISFHYDQRGKLIGESQSSGTGVDYIYLNDIPVALGMSGSPKMYYIYTDQLTTPRLITDDANVAVWTWEGEPFGDTPPNDNPAGAGPFEFHLRFPGQYFDAETNLHYNNHRDYDPTTGRYIESDPINLDGGINTYTYVGGNPMTYTDPLGLWRWGDPLSQSIVDAAAGFGDGVSFGLTNLIRNGLGTNSSVNKCSASYSDSHLAGTVESAGLGVGRLLYAGGAAAIPLLADASEGAVAQALEASAMRNGLKGIFRGDIFGNSTFRMYNPADLLAGRYNGDAVAMLAAAGRSNGVINGLGAAAVAGGIANESGSQCGCK